MTPPESGPCEHRFNYTDDTCCDWCHLTPEQVIAALRAEVTRQQKVVESASNDVVLLRDERDSLRAERDELKGRLYLGTHGPSTHRPEEARRALGEGK